MLQQTRVEAVIPYYRNFLRQFPSPARLAAAPEEQVLAAWTGLGYYSRARNLQRAARAVLACHGGKFPADRQAAMKLPGVGAYTAAAILSIAYNVPLAVLDGNVARVLSRLFALPADVRDGKGKALLMMRAEELLDPRHPGEFNQAMMELGATVCLPGVARCGNCPLRGDCVAHAAGRQREFPPARRRPDEIRLPLIAAVIRDRAGRFLLEKRPEDSSWMPGFWELPTWEALPGGNWKSSSQLVNRIVLGETVGTVRHSITRFRIAVKVYLASAESLPRVTMAEGNFDWLTLQDLRAMPVTTISTKALRLLQVRGTEEK